MHRDEKENARQGRLLTTPPYETYFESEGFGLGAHREAGNSREWNRNDDLSPKTVVPGVEIDETALGFPLPHVRKGGSVIQTTTGGRDIVVFATEADEIHGFVDPGYSFEVTDDGAVADGTGGCWMLTESKPLQ